MEYFRIPSVFPLWLEDVGMKPGSVLRAAGLSSALFDEETAHVDTRQFFAIWKAVGALAKDPAVGLKIGSLTRIERYDPVCISALSARSFRDALEKLARYKRLICPEEIHLTERAGEYVVRFEWLLADEVEPVALTDTVFAFVLALGRRGRAGLNPLRVELTRERPARDVYTAHFGCKIRFGAECNAMIYDARHVDAPFATHNADLLRLLAPQLEAALTRQRARHTLSDQVALVQRKLLAGRRPTIRDVASELHLSSRTLQRRLTDAGVSFQQLLAETRRRMAQHYLRESPLELAEVSYLLGYEDSNSFYRAFQAWEGTSPGQWRAARDNPRASRRTGRTFRRA